MRVPEELTDMALGAAWPGATFGDNDVGEIRDRMRNALEAVLPMVRQRLLSDEAKQAAAVAWNEAHANKMMRFMQTIRPIEGPQSIEKSDIADAALQAAFEAAFPEDPIDAAEGDGRR